MFCYHLYQLSSGTSLSFFFFSLRSDAIDFFLYDFYHFLDGIEKIFKVQNEDTKDKDTMARGEDNIKEHHDLEEASWWKVVRHKVPKW